MLEHVEHGVAAHTGDERLVAVFVGELHVALFGEQLTTRQIGLLGIDDDVRLAVQHALEIFERDVEDVADARRQALEEPDVRDRRRQRDVTETLAPNLARWDDLDAALFADDAAVLHALVLAAVALVIFDRPEDLGAEQAVTLGLERTVVDRLGLLDLAVRPLPNLFGRRQRDADRVEGKRIFGLLEETENVTHVSLRRVLRGGAVGVVAVRHYSSAATSVMVSTNSTFKQSD